MTDKEIKEIKIIEGQSLDESDKFWIEQGKELLKGSIKSIEDAGKQIIAMLTTIQGIYLAAISYAEITKKTARPVWESIPLAFPMLLWLVALFFGLRIFRTQQYAIRLNAPHEIKETCKQIAVYKQKNLTLAYTFIVIGLVVAVFDILMYFSIIAG